MADLPVQSVRYSFIAALFCCAVTGCSDGPEIREYVVEREEERIFTSDLLKSEFPTIPLQWDAPSEWDLAENDQFSTMAWSTGPEGSQARITVSAVPASAGVEPQVIRWRRQIGLQITEETDPMKGVEQLKLGSDEAFYVDISGDTETILGMVLGHEDRLWIFKLKGTNSVADEAADVFRAFCESVRIVRVAGE